MSTAGISSGISVALRRHSGVEFVAHLPSAVVTMSPKTVIDDYIEAFPADVQVRLMKLRAAIRRKAPDAAEKISYGMPTFYLNGNLVHFAAFEHHIGFYPAPSGIEAFKAELAKYKTSKGAIQFPHDEALPLAVIGKIVAFRVAENAVRKAKRRSPRAS